MSDRTNKELVQELIEGGFVRTPLLIEAFQQIDRRDFVPGNLKDEAYANEPLPVGFGQTISQPLTVAFMLELLDPRPGEKVLDIGSGSGWQTALLTYCVGNVELEKGIKGITLKEKAAGVPRGSVIAIERIPELKAMTEKNVGRYGFLEARIVRVVLGDGSRGAPLNLTPSGGFDKIIAAASGGEIPQAWKEQVKIGGKIVAPVEHSLFVLRKVSDRKFETNEHFGFSFVPLIRE